MKEMNLKKTGPSMDSISNLKLQIRLHFIKNFIEQREYSMANGQRLLHLNKNPMPILLLAIGFALSMVSILESVVGLLPFVPFPSHSYLFLLLVSSFLFLFLLPPSLLRLHRQLCVIFICSFRWIGTWWNVTSFTE